MEHRYRVPVFARRAGGGRMEIMRDVEPVRARGSVRRDLGTFWKRWDVIGESIFDLDVVHGFVSGVPRGVDLLVPWTSRRLPIAPGSNLIDMERRLSRVGPAVTPIGKVDRARFPFYAVRRGSKGQGKAARANAVWGLANGSDGDFLDDSVVDVAGQVASQWMTRRQVVFLFREFPICGVVLAAIHICNQLIDLGWDATCACTSLDPVHKKLLPMRFEPLVYPHRDVMIRDLRERLVEKSVVVAPVYLVVDDAESIKEGREDLKSVYFVQDDERRFIHPNGQRYAKKGAVEESYGKPDALVGNSDWVAEILRKLGHEPGMIPIGVDTEMFRPGDDREGLPVVMAHCRPSTPRRGWKFIADVCNLLAYVGVEFKLVTYDEEPEGLNGVRPHEHLGRLAPSEVAEWMRKSDIFFEGSEFQGFGMQALEAMACGCALVVTDNGGIGTFGSSGRDCVVIDHGDVKGAASVVRHLLGSVVERRALGIAGREKALMFDWSEIGEKWNSWLHGLWGGD